MKKEEIIRRCYGGMKERHGVETIILFHVGDSFEAYFDDAETITRITEVRVRGPGGIRPPHSQNQ